MRVWAFVACAACGRVDFDARSTRDRDADAPLPMLAPVQTAVASQSAMASALHVTIPPTTDGNALLLIAAIDTASQNIANVYDDGNNQWMRIVDGADAGLTGRVEMWYVPRAAPVTDVSIHYVAGFERDLAV